MASRKRRNQNINMGNLAQASAAAGMSSHDSSADSLPEMPKRKRHRLQLLRSTTQASPNGNMHRLLRERQKNGRVRFVSREGAGAWSPDPLQQAVGNTPHFLRRMELSGVLRGHRGCVNTISATPDGKYWITGSDDMKLKIWDCESHKQKMSFDSGHTNNVFQARVLPYTNNEKIVTCAADGQVRLTNLTTMKSSKMGGHRGAAHRIAIEPGSPHRFMSCGEDGAVLTYDLRCQGKGTPILHRAECSNIKGMALNPLEPNYFFVCGDSPALDMYDVRNAERPTARFCPEKLRDSRRATITGCAVNWCGSEVVATYNPAGVIYRFDVKKHGQPVEGSLFSRLTTGKNLLAPNRNASGNDDASWGGAAGASSSRGGGAGAGREDDEAEEGGGPPDRTAERFPMGETDLDNDGSYATKFTGHRNILTVKQVTFYGPRSEFVASGSDCGHIFLWEKNRGRLEMLLWGDKVGAVNCLEPHPYLPTLGTSGLSMTAKIWRPTRTEATGIGKLTGKGGKPAQDVMSANKEYTARREERRAVSHVTVDSEMRLRIWDMYPDSGSGDEEGESGSGGGGGTAAGGRVDRYGGRPRIEAHTLASLLELMRAPVALPLPDESDDDDENSSDESHADGHSNRANNDGDDGVDDNSNGSMVDVTMADEEEKSEATENDAEARREGRGMEHDRNANEEENSENMEHDAEVRGETEGMEHDINANEEEKSETMKDDTSEPVADDTSEAMEDGTRLRRERGETTTGIEAENAGETRERRASMRNRTSSSARRGTCAEGSMSTAGTR